ncbi:UNVERIFIED_CONTAM: hypothetical protein FKN15_010322, partial [Acipenser sinensis]
GSTNVGEQLPTGQLSVVPWRRTGVKYTNNEAYFDVVEEIDAIIDKSGTSPPRTPTVGQSEPAQARLLGALIETSLVAIPVYVKHSISFREGSSLGHFEITISPKQTMGKAVEGVLVTSQMPKAVLNMNLTCTQGAYTFDPVTKMLSWDVGKINPQKLPSLKGSMSLQTGASKPDENPTINIQCKIQQLALSGLKVNRLDMYGEKYKPFKGIKYMTKAGKFQNPRLLDDVSFHPCVRFKRWEAERILSFIPPDGNFRLLSYHVSSQNLVAIPVYVKHSISFREGSSLGHFEITISPKQTMGKAVEGVLVTSQMPKAVLNMNLTCTQGAYTFDPVTKMLSWDVGKINPQKLPSLKGSMSLQTGASKPDENPTINIQCKIQQLALSGKRAGPRGATGGQTWGQFQ